MSGKLKKLLDVAEKLDWSYEVCDGYVEMNKHSPAGEDFSMCICFDSENPVKSFINDLKDYSEDFDVDDHVEMWIPGRGERGCPSSISVLVEDAKAIRDMIEELAVSLEEAAA